MNEKVPERVITEILNLLGKTIEDLKSCLFSRNKRQMNETKKVFGANLRASLPLFEEAIQKTEKSPLDRRLLTFLPALQRLGIAVEDLVGGVQTALETDVCLTDRALGEISEMMALLKDLTRDTNDVLSTKNAHFQSYAAASAAHVRARTIECGLEHQERLVVGNCSPKASFLYLDLMDSMKRVAQELGNLCEQA